MTIPLLAIFGLCLLIGFAVWRILLRSDPCKDMDNSKVWGYAAGLVSCGFFYLFCFPMKTIIIIEDNPANSLIPVHKTVYCYGSPIVKGSSKTIDLHSFDLKRRKTYIFNLSSTQLRCYPVRYVFKGRFGQSFSKEESDNNPPTLFIRSKSYVIVPKEPELWFCNPPNEIKENLNRYERTWRILFGSVRVKWCLSL